MTTPDARPMLISTTAFRATHRGWRWPAMVVGLFVVQSVFMGVAIYLAHSNPSVAIEPEYYDKALHWDESAARHRVAVERGWSAVLDVGEASGLPATRPLRLLVTGEDAMPIPGLRVRFETFHHAASASRIFAEAAYDGGAFVAEIPMLREGLWEVRAFASEGNAELRIVEHVRISPEPSR